MNNKSKIIVIIISIILELALLIGAYSIGRFHRYKGTTEIGNNVIENITGAKDDVSTSKENVDISALLLENLSKENKENLKTIAQLKSNNEKNTEVIDSFIINFNKTEETLSSFKENYNGSPEDLAWDIVTKEAEEMERLLAEYKKILEKYERIGE